MAFLTKKTDFFKTNNEAFVTNVGNRAYLTDGVASGFQGDTSILTQWMFAPQEGDTWEILVKFRTAASVAGTQQFIGGVFSDGASGIEAAVCDGKFRWWLGSTTSYNIVSAGTGTHLVQPNTDYWVKIVYDSEKYTLSYSTDGEYFTQDMQVVSSLSIYPDCKSFGCDAAANSSYFQGSIDFNETYVNINGERWWDINHPHIMDGYWVVDGVVSGFSTARYLQVPWSFNAAVGNSAWEIVGKFNLRAGGAVNPIYGGLPGTYVMDIFVNENNRLGLNLSSTGSSYNITTGLAGNTTFELMKDYWCKLTFDGAKYVLSYSEDGVEFFEEIVVESELKLEPTYDRLCIGFRDSAYFMGTIDLKECYIKIDDSYWWYGVQVDKLNPKSITDFGDTKYFRNEIETKYWNYGDDYSGINVNMGVISNGIASNFSYGSYLQIPSFTADKITEAQIVFTTGLDVTSYQGLFFSATYDDSSTFLVQGGEIKLLNKYRGSGRYVSSMGLLLKPNTRYYFKFEQSGTVITPYLSLDGITYHKGYTVSRGRTLRNFIGYGLDNDSGNHPFFGKVELTSDTYIKVDGEIWWTGQDAIKTGSWIDDGIAGTFSGGRYIKDKTVPFSTSESVEMVVSAQAITMAGNQAIIGNMTDSGSGGGVVIRTVGSNRLYMWLSSTVGSWSVAQWDTGVDISSEWRMYKFIFTPTDVSCFWSDDGGNTWSPGGTITVNGVAEQIFQIGGAANNIPWLGMIDLHDTYVKVNNEMWWHGTKAIPATESSYTFSSEREVGVEVEEGQSYDYSLHYPSSQYTYSYSRNDACEITRFKSFYYAYTDQLETLRNGTWGNISDEGVATGFTSENYFTIPPLFSPEDKPWSFNSKFSLSAVTSSYSILGSNGTQSCNNFLVRVVGGLFRTWITSNGTSWDIASNVAGTATLVAGKDYYVRMEYDGTRYVLSYSEDGETYIEDISIQNATRINQGQGLSLGNHRYNTTTIDAPFVGGTIYLPDTYIDIDGERWWDWKTDIVPDGQIMNCFSWDKNGKASSMNTANYCLLLPKDAIPTGINWEVGTKITTGSNISSEQCIIGDWIPYRGFLLQIYSGKMQLYASSNNSSWDIASGVASALSVTANTTYYIKFSYDGVKYSLDLSTDGAIYENYITLETDKIMYPGRHVACSRYGGDRACSTPFLGTMDLTESYMQVGDNLVWTGMRNLINQTYYFNLVNSWIRKDENTKHVLVGNTTPGNYMRTSRPVFSSYKKDIEVYLKVKMTENPVASGSIQYFMAPNYATFLWGINTDGRLAVYNNSSWYYGSVYYTPGEWIWVKVVWDGSNYKTYSILDSEYTKDTLPPVGEWVLENTFANTTNIFSTYNVFLGWDDNSSARYFRGILDYSELFIKVDGKIIWTGTAVEEIPETEVTVDIEYYKEIRHQVQTLTYACYSQGGRYVYAKAPIGGYDTVYCYRGNDMSVETMDASLLASAGYTYTNLTEESASFNLVGDYTLPRYFDGDIYRTTISIETVPGTPDDYTYTKISENFGYTETRLVAAPLINVSATKRYYFKVLLDTDIAGEHTFTIPEDSEYTRITIVGGGGAAALLGRYDDRGYGWGGGSAGAYDGEFALTPGEYTATVGSANNNAKPQGGNSNTINPDDTTTHDTWVDGVVRVGGGGAASSGTGVGAAGASATFEMEPQNSRLNSVGRVGVYGSGGKGSQPSAYCPGGVSVYNGYGTGQGCYTSEYAGGRWWVNGTGGYLKVVSASLSPEGGYDYFEDILKG